MCDAKESRNWATVFSTGITSLIAMLHIGSADAQVCQGSWGENASISVPGFNGSVSAFGSYNGELIAGGRYTSAGGQPANMVAHWNGSVWQALGNIGPYVPSISTLNSFT